MIYLDLCQTHRSLVWEREHTAKQVPSIKATGVRFNLFVTSPMAHMLGMFVQEYSSTCHLCLSELQNKHEKLQIAVSLYYVREVSYIIWNSGRQTLEYRMLIGYKELQSVLCSIAPCWFHLIIYLVDNGQKSFSDHELSSNTEKILQLWLTDNNSPSPRQLYYQAQLLQIPDLAF